MASLNYDEEVKRFREYYDHNYELWNKGLTIFGHLINNLLSENYDNLTIQSRIKDKEGAIEKFARKYQKPLEDKKTEYEIKDYITDIIGMRIICLYEADIDKVKDILSKHFDVLEVTNKTKDIEENKIDSFGYKGLHLDLKLSQERCNLPEYKDYSNFRFEVQIRTIIQDAWSTLDHKIKYKKDVSPSIQRRIYALAALFEIADKEFFSISQQVEEYKGEKENAKDEELLNIFKFNKIIEKYYKEDFITKANHLNKILFSEKIEKTNEQYYNVFKEKTLDNLKNNIFNKIIETNNITVSEFEQYLYNWYKYINEFSRDLFKDGFSILKLSIEHCILCVLYKGNKEKFSKYLSSTEREMFDKWDAEQQKKK